MSLMSPRKNGPKLRAASTRMASIVLVLGAAGVGVTCSGATPRPVRQEDPLAVNHDAGAEVTGGTENAPDSEVSNVAEVEPEGEPSPSAPPSSDAEGPREDPVPWSWIEELVAEEEQDIASRPYDNFYNVDFIDLDGDDQEELVVSWGVGQANCRCELRAAVARRTNEGYQLASAFSGSIDVVNFPGGLRGLVHYPNDGDEYFELLVLRPGRRSFTTLFRGDYDSAAPTGTRCVREGGDEYEAQVLGAPVFIEREGVRVLEEIREEAGCHEGPPNTTIRRVEDLLRRAGLLPADL